MISGVYAIINIINGKLYIGSTTNFVRRELTHFLKLEGNRHPSSCLQRDFIKYGRGAFLFKILKTCSPTKEDLDKWEQFYFDSILFAQEYIRSNGNDKRFLKLGYNRRPLADRCNYVKASSEKIAKMSRAHLGIKPTLATRILMSKSQKGKTLGSKHYAAKKIIQLDLKAQCIKIWSCAAEASRITNISYTSIKKAIFSKSHYSNNYLWMLRNEYEQVDKEVILEAYSAKRKVSVPSGLRKSIVQLNNAMFVEEFPSVALAAKAVNTSTSCISRAAKYGNSAYGFKWMYSKDYELMLI